ncbi:MAG: helix-turn-helix domain-containing protein [Pirellulaceae bacterium]
MPRQLTPKQVARATGVSESSIKRWCDDGRIATVRTAGGHRRILTGTVLEFLRESGHPLSDPTVLGLPATTGKGPRTLEKAQGQMLEALKTGDEVVCRQVVFDLLLSGHRVSVICDEVIAESFHQIGDAWDCGELQVYRERRACEVAVRVLHEVRRGLAARASGAPLAMGAAPSGDYYTLPTAMVELTLRDRGWGAVSLGSNLPFDTLRAAIVDHRPRLFWLSVSHLACEASFLEGYASLVETAGAATAIAVGGRALTEDVRRRMTFAAHCDTLSQLESFAAALWTPTSSAAKDDAPAEQSAEMADADGES